MALCPNGQKTTIEWQYSGEDKQQIVGADNYTVEQEIGKSPVKYQAFGTFININLNSGGCRSILYWRTNYAQIGTAMQSWQPVNYQSFHVGCPAKNGSYTFLVPISKAQYDSRYMPDSSATYLFYDKGNCIAAGAQPIGYDFKLTNVVRVDGLPDNYGNCVFTITKNNQVVYTKTRPACPTVTYTCGNQCPPGTCQCDCGSEVCCYDTTTGKVIKSFKK